MYSQIDGRDENIDILAHVRKLPFSVDGMVDKGLKLRFFTNLERRTRFGQIRATHLINVDHWLVIFCQAHTERMRQP